MRMRKPRHLDERLNKCRDYLIESFEEINNIHSPFYIEIGCGKGRFITENAKAYPNINFMAVERITNVMISAVEKANAQSLSNVKFFIGDAIALQDLLKNKKCDRIYLNFSDPWPKAKQAKRRLTHKNYLDIYKNILIPGGEIFFKTDNKDLFEFSLNSFADNGFLLSNISFDLHNSGYCENIQTEYEMRFSEKGFPIYRVEARLSR